MPKVTQNYTLFKLLESGEAITVDKIKEALEVNYYSVAVYISEMKRLYKADIESVREGRRVLSYRLINAADIEVPMYRSNNDQYVKPTKKPIEEVRRTDFDDNEVDLEMDSREVLDTYESLGIEGPNIGGE